MDSTQPWAWQTVIVPSWGFTTHEQDDQRKLGGVDLTVHVLILVVQAEDRWHLWQWLE